MRSEHTRFVGSVNAGSNSMRRQVGGFPSRNGVQCIQLLAAALAQEPRLLPVKVASSRKGTLVRRRFLASGHARKPGSLGHSVWEHASEHGQFLVGAPRRRAAPRCQVVGAARQHRCSRTLVPAAALIESLATFDQEHQRIQGNRSSMLAKEEIPAQ